MIAISFLGKLVIGRANIGDRLGGKMKTRNLVFGLCILLCVGLVNFAYAASPGRFIKMSTSGEMFLNYALNISGQQLNHLSNHLIY